MLVSQQQHWYIRSTPTCLFANEYLVLNECDNVQYSGENGQLQMCD
jgi:hypothetical protein